MIVEVRGKSNAAAMMMCRVVDGSDARLEMREFFAGIRILYDVKVLTPFSCRASNV